jgi:DNA-binding response OmpR family regulator
MGACHDNLGNIDCIKYRGDEKMTDANATAGQGKILIVDDDPVVSFMLGASLGTSGFDIAELESGEDCLLRIADIQPDVLFLDIEMPGIDGYETCRRLRARDDTQDLMIIFLSAKDNIDSRLAAFDAGGDDFIAKPFIGDEVCRKAKVAVRLKQARKQLLSEKNLANSDTLLALTSLEETNIVLNFTRSSLRCHSLESLATLTVDTLKRCGLNSHVQIRSKFGTLTMTANGPASPLDASVIALSKEQDRIFQFKKRMIINYDSMSILVTDMPIEDNSAVGRIRDYAAIICEAGEDAVDNIVLRLESNARAEELQQIVESTQTALAKLHSLHQTQQSDIRCGLGLLNHKLSDMYDSLGLLQSQEVAISNVFRNAVNEVIAMLDQGYTVEADFKLIIERLAKASEYRVSVEDEGSTANAVELF